MVYWISYSIPPTPNSMVSKESELHQGSCGTWGPSSTHSQSCMSVWPCARCPKSTSPCTIRSVSSMACLFPGCVTHRICLGLSVGDFLVPFVGHTVQLNNWTEIVIKLKPYGMLLPRVTFRNSMILCHDVYELSSLRVAAAFEVLKLDVIFVLFSLIGSLISATESNMSIRFHSFLMTLSWCCSFRKQ